MSRVDEAFAAWGDRLNRDIGQLMDLAVAGTIDQIIGHGTVVLKPYRLEEIVSRIGPRERDEDGNWRVTLLPPGGSPHDRAPFAREVLDYIDEARRHEPDYEDMASFILYASKPGVTLRDLGMAGFAAFVEWVDERRGSVETRPHPTALDDLGSDGEHEREAVNTERTSAEIASIAGRVLQIDEILQPIDVKALLRDAKRLAGSALTQRG